ncbi:SURP and G-patch domain-containing protein 1 [Lates japonicus]|uniref:SURP and G-patch domain-containing protein 1 n=1 Tax=Lates japonicus TaxID=270547 RepID=A0AAD3MNZ3_LATJO|nr:SURP and G-patch domain-containing protein 1 [Lates japonicus]
MESSDAGRGGWKTKPAQPQKNKMNMNILRQEKLIAQKKKEIEARMAEQAKINAQTTSKPLPPSGSPSLQGASSNKFANDGSFLQQFMKMQKEKSNNVPGSTSETKTPSTSPGGNALHKKSILVGKRPGLGVSSMLSQFKSYSQSKKNPVLSQRPSVFCSPDDDEEEDADYSKFLEMKVSPPEDSDTRLIIDKMASFVAEGGPELEKKAKEDYRDNPVFSFLYDKSSMEYLYYKNRVAELRRDLLKPENTSDNVSPPVDAETQQVAEKLARFVAEGGPRVTAAAGHLAETACSWLAGGRDPDYSEYKEFKLTVEDLGFRMLMKMGWKEGDRTSNEQTGLGIDRQLSSQSGRAGFDVRADFVFASVSLVQYSVREQCPSPKISAAPPANGVKLANANLNVEPKRRQSGRGIGGHLRTAGHIGWLSRPQEPD